MSTTGSAAPGWYPDPSDQTQLRYWDGAAWTEALAPAAGAHLSDQLAAGPPVAPSASGLGDVGSWLSAVFAGLVSRLGPVLVLLYVLPLVGWIAVLLLTRSLLTGMSYDRATDEFVGFEAGLLFAIGVVILALIVISIVGWLAAHHQLYGAHAGEPQALGRSLANGVRRLPRTIGWGLLFVLAVLAITVVVGGVIGLGVAAAGPGFLFTLLLIVPVLVVAAIWIAVRLALAGTALAVGPAGTNPFRASWRISEGRFWAVFGRLLLLWIIIYIVSFVTQFATQIGGVFVAGQLDYRLNDAGQLVIDGQVVSELEVISFETFMPSAPILIALIAVYVLNQAISQALSVGGSAGLYYRGGGPAEL